MQAGPRKGDKKTDEDQAGEGQAGEGQAGEGQAGARPGEDFFRQASRKRALIILGSLQDHSEQHGRRPLSWPLAGR